MLRPGSTSMVPPPLIRRPTLKRCLRAASRSTSLASTWWLPSTRDGSAHSQKRRVGPRSPAMIRSRSTSSSASWACVLIGKGMTLSQPSSARWSSRRPASARSAEKWGGRSGRPQVKSGSGLEAVVLEPGCRDLVRVGLVHVRLLVHLDQVVGGELGRDVVESGGGVTRQDLGAPERNDVVGVLQVLVVLQLDVLAGRVGAVAGEDEADVDVALVPGRLGQRAASVERLEGLEVQPVDPLQPGLAEGAGGALKRTAKRPLRSQRHQVGKRLVGAVLAALEHRECVLVGGG